MMQRAAQYHAQRSALIVAVLALMFWFTYESLARSSALLFRGELLNATTAEIPNIMKKSRPHRRWLVPLLPKCLRRILLFGRPLHASSQH
jgi:hypothetical protein